MIYGSLQSVYMESKHIDDIHRYETPIFTNIIVHVSKLVNTDNQILWRL